MWTCCTALHDREVVYQEPVVDRASGVQAKEGREDARSRRGKSRRTELALSLRTLQSR